MGSAAVLSEEAENLFGELRSRTSEAEKRVNVSSLIGSGGRNSAEADVEREAEGAADGRNAADDVGTVNRAAVPGIGSSVSSFHEDGVSATIISSNGDGFIEEAMKVFDADSFVVAFGSDVERDVEEEADGLKQAFESAAVVDDDNTTEADFEEDVLDKEAGKIMGGNIVSSRNEYKPG